MSAPVLTDLFGIDFTEGDRVVYSSVNGVRVGLVDAIKDITHPNPCVNIGRKNWKVYINLSEHHKLFGHSKMYAKRQGYNYTPQHFLKV